MKKSNLPNKTEVLSVDLPRIDAGTQSRLAINEEVVADYADLIAESNGEWPFPPLDVFHDGTDYYVADGFHRLLGGRRAKRGSIPCQVHTGTATDARIFGMTANDKHGMRMSRADKRACVEWLLKNGGKMTQKAIAEAAGVTARTVKMVVADQNPVSIAGKASPPKRDGKGKTSPSTPIQGDSGPVETPTPPKTGQRAQTSPNSPPGGDSDEPPPPSKGRQEDAGGGSTRKPPKQFPRSHWFKQWESGIGPVCRLVDKIADEVGEKHGAHHDAVQEFLNSATEEIMVWMKVKK